MEWLDVSFEEESREPNVVGIYRDEPGPYRDEPVLHRDEPLTTEHNRGSTGKSPGRTGNDRGGTGNNRDCTGNNRDGTLAPPGPKHTPAELQQRRGGAPVNADRSRLFPVPSRSLPVLPGYSWFIPEVNCNLHKLR
ncbi:hypothetical protein DPMN_042255 [Dreissena polymorpha]|uniref:Uncharacterized protein n=1 Tax=Dreissena polymorpha TaxID=45954 RepID=A0A9D4CZ96_DREPO|nr:hypothetical protein DPMN_042255 [Dreissena polymorpha]